MQHIPDAPWIREAENLGMPPYEDPPECPICGEYAKEFFMSQDGEIFACDNCLRTQDAWEWLDEEKERNRPE